MINVKGYTECLKARKNGVEYYIPGFGTLLIRRCGLADWQQAIRDATEDILGMNYSYNYINPKSSEEITAKACADYAVVKLLDCYDAEGNKIPDTLANKRNVFESEANYSLVQEIVQAAMEGERFLLDVVQEEAEEIKK